MSCWSPLLDALDILVGNPCFIINLPTGCRPDMSSFRDSRPRVGPEYGIITAGGWMPWPSGKGTERKEAQSSRLPGRVKGEMTARPESSLVPVLLQLPTETFSSFESSQPHKRK